MAYHEQEIKEYKIVHWNNYGEEKMRINCYLTGGLVGVIHLLAEGEDLVPTYRSRVIHLKYPVSEFKNLVNTIRYEKPMYIFYNDSDGTPFGGIKTSDKEPVGEEES